MVMQWIHSVAIYSVWVIITIEQIAQKLENLFIKIKIIIANFINYNYLVYYYIDIVINRKK